MTNYIRFMGKFIGNFIIVCVMLLIVGCSGSDTIVKEISDGGSSTETGNPGKTITIAGYAQKGPAGIDTLVDIYFLDDNFIQTGISYRTQTDEIGRFSFPTTETTATYVELYSEGFYYDEIVGSLSSSGQLDLSGWADIERTDIINVNILTTLAKKRILYLIDSGLNFEDAYEQTRVEVLNIFGIEDSSATRFEDMNMLEDGDSNGILLAVSAIMMQMAHDEATGGAITAELSAIIVNISNDIEADGILNDTTLLSVIEKATMTVDITAVRSNMERDFSAYVIPPFEQYIIGDLNIRWTGFDCTANNISSVEAVINDIETGNIAAGPWTCTAQESTDIDLNAGIYDLVTVNFLDNDGDLVSQAEATDVSISIGQTTILDIEPGSFVTGGVSVQWTSDCSNNDIASIQATFYDNSGIEIQTAGPWDCDDNNRSIGDISDLTGGSALFVYSDHNDNEICRADLTDIDVISGQTTIIGPLEIIPPEITQPLSGATFQEGDTITFAGTGSDFQGNSLSGADLEWTSDIDGNIGDGETFDTAALSYGLHTITLTAIDSTLGTISTSITLHIRSAGGEIYVGPGEAYTTIQSAVDAADPYDRIIVRDGTYTENVDVNKELIIESENGYTQTTVAAADSSGYVFYVTADFVTIEGFTIYGATDSGSRGMYLYNASNCTVTNNRFGVDGVNYNHRGMTTYYGGSNIISNNLFYSNSYLGIQVASDNNTVSNNICDGNSLTGIAVSFNNNIILNNNVINSENGIKLTGASGSTVSGNTCTLSSYRGIALDGATNNTISNNTCETNRFGIYMFNSSNNNYILYNTCSSNTNTGITMSNGNENTFSGNTCSSNTYNGITIATDFNTISDNTCTLNIISGIYLTSACNNSVSGNFCSENDIGIRIGSPNSNNNIISKNRITLNIVQGLHIYSGANTLYQNDFIDNTVNILSTDCVNAWSSPTEITYTYNGSDYTGYLGNYYSDHVLTDTDGDGVTDSSYDLSGDEPDDAYSLAGTSDNYN